MGWRKKTDIAKATEVVIHQGRKLKDGRFVGKFKEVNLEVLVDPTGQIKTVFPSWIQ